WIGAKTGLSLIWFILPRLIPALILTGMLQVVIPQEAVAQYFGHGSGLSAILMASVAGVLTPGGPMVSVPLLVVLANSGMALAPLGKHGQIMRVAAPVSRDLEIAEITDRVSKGPADRNVALLFESVRGFGMPVLINAFGAPGRMAAALGVERLDDLAGRVAKLLDLKMPGSFFDKLRKVGDLFDLAKAGPKHVRSAPCQEVVESDHPSLA